MRTWIMSDISLVNAENQIIELLTKLNDSNPITSTTCRGLWYTGGLDEGNSMIIHFKEGKHEGCGCDD